jgi:predicted DNA-binding transcriptional regulator AlpA
MKDLITIDEVCEIAKVSKPTVYRRVKQGTFPKPKKIKAPNARGPNKVNRWERGEVMGWLLKGNDPNWNKQPMTHKELATAMEPGLNVLFGKEALQPDEAARLAEGATDLYDEPFEEQTKINRYLVQAVIAAVLAGLIALYFNAG